MPLANTDHPQRIPYGVADFWKLRRDNEYYVDKTHFIPRLEEAGRFLFLIRPRRFGKSLLQSMLECYYDQRLSDQFDELFSDTWIAGQPTPEQGQYLVLRFDFSMVDPDSRRLESSFEDHIRITLGGFLKRYRASIPAETAEAILAESSAPKQLERLFAELRELGLFLYIFIDEYDNFANTLLVSEGQAKYQEVTHGGGFLRHFFAVFKGGAGQTGGGLTRLFITGVSPITMDDVTSGFNIGLNISLDPRFHAVVGFTEAEMEQLFIAFGEDHARHRDLLHLWYDHYRFAKDSAETVTNSDMALYFLQYLHGNGKPPRDLIDYNLRIDYGKLRHLVQVDRRLNGNFSRLRQVIEEETITVNRIVQSFPVEELRNQDNFLSLLYYLGLLTHTGEQTRG